MKYWRVSLLSLLQWFVSVIETTSISRVISALRKFNKAMKTCQSFYLKNRRTIRELGVMLSSTNQTFMIKGKMISQNCRKSSEGLPSNKVLFWKILYNKRQLLHCSMIYSHEWWMVGCVETSVIIFGTNGVFFPH